MKVFISYRRNDLAGFADILVGRLADRLILQFGKHNVFLDSVSLTPGIDFSQKIKETINQVDVMLVIIGSDWLSEIHKRIATDDYVVMEIHEALTRMIPVIPLSIGDAQIPAAHDLPTQIKTLVSKNAFNLDTGKYFHTHVSLLIEDLLKLSIPEYIVSGEFRAVIYTATDGHTKRYYLQLNKETLSFDEVLDLWLQDEPFKDFFQSLLQNCGMASYVWETPPITTESISRDFEFVLKGNPEFFSSPDHSTYKDYYALDTDDDGVVTFPNLGKDALLIVPIPQTSLSDFSNLSKFIQNATREHHHALWTQVAIQAKKMVSKKPIWISVAGGGVNWLHIRLDTSPKYYRFEEYRMDRAGL